MKTTDKLTRLVLILGQSQWLRPAVLTLVVAVLVVGITGRKPHH